MKRSLKSKEVGSAAESEATRTLREIIGVSANGDAFKAGEALAVIGALAERALHRFERIPLSSKYQLLKSPPNSPDSPAAPLSP